MSRIKHCVLCGRRLIHDDLIESDGWRARYCCLLCYEVDQTLPEPEDEVIFALPHRVLMVRYDIILQGDADPIYKSKFDEEEDGVMRDDK